MTRDALWWLASSTVLPCSCNVSTSKQARTEDRVRQRSAWQEVSLRLELAHPTSSLTICRTVFAVTRQP
jgi:hypothetical protein